MTDQCRRPRIGRYRSETERTMRINRGCRRRVAAVLVGALVMGVSIGVTTANAVVSAPWTKTPTQTGVVRGTFTQRKYLAELERPLISTGRFVVADSYGLLWQIERPIQAQLVITRQHLVRRSNGHEIARIGADRQPALRVVAAVLLAVFQADMDRLRQYFEIEAQSRDQDRWAMTLRPTGGAVSAFIERLRIQGAAHIERIEIDQPGGDRSVIELHVATLGPATLSAEEQRQFLR